METTTTATEPTTDSATVTGHLAEVIALGRMLDAADDAMAEYGSAIGDVDEIETALDRIRNRFAEAARAYVRELAAGNSSPAAA